MNITIPLKIESTANLREHWAKKAHRARVHRQGVHFALMANLLVKPPLPCVVWIARIAPRRLDDDNNVGGLKCVRDGIADWLGIDDRDPRVTWHYGQETGKPGEYAVKVGFA